MSSTSGTLALGKAEIIRLRRNKRYLFFTLALPIVLYLSLAHTAATEGGVSFKIYYLFEMASLGAFSGAFNNNAIRISQERKDGWIRQLRLTCLPANSYVVAKIMAPVALTVSAAVASTVSCASGTPTDDLTKLSLTGIYLGGSRRCRGGAEDLHHSSWR